MGVGGQVGFFFLSLPLEPHKNGKNQEKESRPHVHPVGREEAESASEKDRHDVLDQISGANSKVNSERMALAGHDEDGDGGFIRELRQEDKEKGGEEKLHVHGMLEKVGQYPPGLT
jgi:hypothetical protein